MEWKVNHGLSKKQHLKEEIMRNRERLSLLSDRHKMSSGTQGGAKERNHWYPRALESHYKRKKQPTLKGQAVRRS